tara:strand:+ start:351 stop:875 length:525 start_codon:yes stop_codon:yes gene_type:complete
MRTKRIPLPVKLICGFIYSQEAGYLKVKKILRRKFGKIDFESQVINFNLTDYYSQEMGKHLFRRFISFEKLRDPSRFADIKLLAMKLEDKFSQGKKRTINIDPGYLNQARLVLLSSKDFAHRIYLSKGIYAEVTLCFHKGKVSDLVTTFPDYRTKIYKDIFYSIRTIYCQDLKK